LAMILRPVTAVALGYSVTVEDEHRAARDENPLDIVDRTNLLVSASFLAATTIIPVFAIGLAWTLRGGRRCCCPCLAALQSVALREAKGLDLTPQVSSHERSLGVVSDRSVDASPPASFCSEGSNGRADNTKNPTHESGNARHPRRARANSEEATDHSRRNSQATEEKVVVHSVELAMAQVETPFSGLELSSVSHLVNAFRVNDVMQMPPVHLPRPSAFSKK